MRNPVNMAGSAAGNMQLPKRVNRLALMQREQVVLRRLGRLQPEQRVGDDREHGDEHDR